VVVITSHGQCQCQGLELLVQGQGLKDMREEGRRIAEKVGGREIVEDLQEKMRELRVKCIICKAVGGERGRRCQRKDWQSCELVTEVERKAMESGIEASKKILMEKFAGCWRYWMPQEGCRR